MSMTMNDAEFATLSRQSDYILRDLCNIEREVVTGKDQYGKEIREWVPISYDVKCNKAPVITTRIVEGEIQGRIVARESWWFTVPIGTNVRTSDRMVIDGNAFYVDIVMAPQSYSVVTRLVCVENA